jgi:anti-sigma factor RsiW
MNCDRFRKELARYLQDELSAEERASWRAHLRACAGCRSEALRSEPSLLFLLTDHEAPDAGRVEQRLAAAMTEIRSRRLERNLRVRRLRRLAAAAVLVLAGGLGGIVLAPHGGHQAVPTAALEESATAEAVQPPAVEVEMGSDVMVYQLAAEDSDTAMAFVVNPGLQL